MTGNKNSGNRTGRTRKSSPRPQSQARKDGQPFSTRHLDGRGVFDRSALSKTDTVNKGLEAIELLTMYASKGDVAAIQYLASIGLQVVEERIEPIVVFKPGDALTANRKRSGGSF
jgi:hypothetical protein